MNIKDIEIILDILVKENPGSDSCINKNDEFYDCFYYGKDFIHSEYGEGGYWVIITFNELTKKALVTTNFVTVEGDWKENLIPVISNITTIKELRNVLYSVNLEPYIEGN